MKTIIEYHDLGNMDYEDAWKHQEALFRERVDGKLLRRKYPCVNTLKYNDLLLFVEHPHVYTLGKSGNQNNLLIKKDFLKKIKATYYQTDRGGDITYHGPGANCWLSYF